MIASAERRNSMKQNNNSIWKTEPYSIFRTKINGLDEPKAFYRDAKIRYSPDSLRDCSGIESCWPVYAIRGRPVSPELALEIIRKTDLYRFSRRPSDSEPDDEAEQRDIFLRFQCEFRDELPDYTIVVRGLIGSMENRVPRLWKAAPANTQ